MRNTNQHKNIERNLLGEEEEKNFVIFIVIVVVNVVVVNVVVALKCCILILTVLLTIEKIGSLWHPSRNTNNGTKRHTKRRNNGYSFIGH